MNQNCIICGSKKNKLYFNKNNFNICKCKECGLKYVSNIPDDLSKYYSKGYFKGDLELDGYLDYESEKNNSKETYKYYLHLINKFSPQSCFKTMFEIGCATGCFLELAQNKEWKVSGMDISSFAVDEAVEKGLDVHCGVIGDEFMNNKDIKYDAVVMLDVLEHLKEPDKDLVSIHSIVKKNGLLVLLTPDAGSFYAKVWGKFWHAFVPPQHLYYFSKKNVKEFLSKNGFEIVYFKHHGKKFSLPYIFRMLYTWQNLKFWSKLANFCSNNWLKKVSIQINLFDTMFVVARKIK